MVHLVIFWTQGINDASMIWMFVLQPGHDKTATGRSDRKLYERTNKVVEKAAGKMGPPGKAHVFADDAADTDGPLTPASSRQRWSPSRHRRRMTA